MSTGNIGKFDLRKYLAYGMPPENGPKSLDQMAKKFLMQKNTKYIFLGMGTFIAMESKSQAFTKFSFYDI